MEVNLTKKHHAVRRSIRSFCHTEILPIAKELDDERRFPWEVVDQMGKLGCFGVQAPATLGGAGMDTVSYTIAIEEISQACAGLGLCVAVHNSVAVFPLLAFGSDPLKQRFVPEMAAGKRIGAFCLTEPNAGSDASGIEATAIQQGDHYILNANKIFVTNGKIADVCLIFARTDPTAGPKGVSVIAVERGTPGFYVSDVEDMMGMRVNPVCSIRLHDCKVPVENTVGQAGRGLAIGLAALDVGRIGIAAQAVGIAQAALTASIAYAKQRRQFGVPIAEHQAVQTMLADMGTLVAASRLMVFRAATLKDEQQPFALASAMAKLFASEAASKVTDMAVQIHGGYGYSKHYPVERYFRDARVTRIYEGTSEIHKMVIARHVMRG
ncbi:MAG: acyl-CoA dehydrogenase family protein [Myxococcota bacterium]|nr:acyl-CoA dehydrogenase family protein [Myxococcota bacterium]